jgi:UDP-N-acetylglucosamine transferase subunit ALG13
MPAVTPVRDRGLREPAGPRVLLTVGTDHHPFDRLVRWANDWLEVHPEQVPWFFVQSGTASVRPICPGSAYLDAGQLDAELDQADVVVCHGGPATIAAGWSRGLLPIAVPRLPQLGEHVDDHQLSFCLKLAELGRVRLAQTPAEFASLLEEVARDRAAFHGSVPATDVDAAVARFGELVDGLVSRSPSRLPLIYRGRRQRRAAGGIGNSAGLSKPPSGFPRAVSRQGTDAGVRADPAGRQNKERG